MDESESLVKAHLVHCGFKRIIYEPDGNNPPDFLLDDRIAVEVRRLNQNELTESGRLKGLEEDRIPTQRRFQQLLHSLGPASSGMSWFVRYSLRRPLARWKDIEPELRRQLEIFRNDARSQKLCRIRVAKGFDIEIIHKASKCHPTCFLDGGGSDGDTGGFILAETQKNLRLCVAEKLNRIARVRHRYPEWWLALVDRIGFGVGASDLELFREYLAMDTGFDRVILLSPLDVTWAFEVPSRK
jgi:hypothetical protein